MNYREEFEKETGYNIKDLIRQSEVVKLLGMSDRKWLKHKVKTGIIKIRKH